MAKARDQHENGPLQIRPVQDTHRPLRAAARVRAFRHQRLSGNPDASRRGLPGLLPRIKAGKAPGYPRFKSVSRWDSLSWSDVSGWKLTESSRRLYLQGVGHVKANLHTPLRGTPKTLVVRRRGRHLEATVFCADVPKTELAQTGNSIGIDLGVGVLVATSEGTLHLNPRYRRQLAPGLARAQRERSLHRRGSYRYRT